MQEGTSLVWRDAFYLGSLNSNDLPRHLISMEEDTLLVCRNTFLPYVLTIGDDVDSTNKSFDARVL